jgi:hypothetical protein
MVFVDAVILGNEVEDLSITEITQEILLFGSAAIFWFCAWKQTQSRGFFALVAGFFSCMFIRELDSFFNVVWDGFWFWPAITVAIATISYTVFYCRGTVMEAMADFIDKKPFYHIIFGLIIILVFSRVFGSGTLIWKYILSDGYHHVAKSAIQEGIELLGYIFLFYGSFLFFRERKAQMIVAPGKAQ